MIRASPLQRPFWASNQIAIGTRNLITLIGCFDARILCIVLRESILKFEMLAR
jgi:hypothetical protein